MDWGTIAQWGALLLALVLAGDRVVGRFVQPKFATIDELSGVERVHSDRINDQEKAIIALRGELRALPSSEKIDKITEDVGELKTGQARTDERLEAIREDVHHMRQALDRAVGVGGR